MVIRNILTNQSLGLLDGVAQADDPHTVFLKTQNHIVTGFEAEGFSVHGRNDNPATIANLCPNLTHVPFSMRNGTKKSHGSSNLFWQ